MPNQGESLADLFPKIAAEWDYEKNPDDPKEIKPQSHKVRHWKCNTCGNCWKTQVGSRTSKGATGCPVCTTKKRAQKNAKPDSGKSLADLFPELAKEWDYEKNDNLTPYEVRPGSNTKRWWLCPDCGESFALSPTERTARGRGCKKCRTKGTSFPEQAILWYIRRDVDDAAKSRVRIATSQKPVEVDIWLPKRKIAIEHNGRFWHRNSRSKDKNKEQLLKKMGIELYVVIEGDNNKTESHVVFYDAVRKRDVNLAWAIVELEKLLGIKANGAGINPRDDRFLIMGTYITGKKDVSLAARFPDIAREWDYERNSPLRPHSFTPGSGVSVWWKCSACGFVWQAVIQSRTHLGAGCPKCGDIKTGDGIAKPRAGESLAERYPDIAAKWDDSNNYPTTARDIKPLSRRRKYFWKGKCGHRWEETSEAMVRNKGKCPYCERRGRGIRLPDSLEG